MPPDEKSRDVPTGMYQPGEWPRTRSGRPARRGGLRTFTSLQKNPDYRFLFTGNLFANAAQWLQFITIGWLALDVSGSAFHSIMAVAGGGGAPLGFGPPGGVLGGR